MLVSSKHNGIYARSSGTASIYAVSKVDPGKSDFITVTVTSGTICVDSVTLNRTGLHLEKGERFNPTATVCPTNATNKSMCCPDSILVTSIDVFPASRTLLVGWQATLNASVWPTNAENKCVKWSSSDTSVATVNETNYDILLQLNSGKICRLEDIKNAMN